MVVRTLLSLLLVLSSFGATLAQPASQSPYGKAARRDSLFLRFPEMAERYCVIAQTLKNPPKTSVSVG